MKKSIKLCAFLAVLTSVISCANSNKYGCNYTSTELQPIEKKSADAKTSFTVYYKDEVHTAE